MVRQHQEGAVQDGMSDGIQDGIQDGMSDGILDGILDGMPDGMPDTAAGLMQGKTELTRFRLATGLFQRARGLLGSKASKEILLLVPCKDIHTVGMRYAIDVAFIDQSGTVVLVRRDVNPGRRIACKGAVAVLERSADAQSAWYERGDVVLMGCASSAR